MKVRKYLYFLIFAMAVLTPRSGHALSFALDSIAEWGRFPRFCVNTYRWGDRFFNTYDSTYVQGTGYKFNVKARSETWTDNYIFRLPDYRMYYSSEWNTSGGLYLTYLAVSLGYDINMSSIFGGARTSRKKFNFGFNCALFTADLYWVTNNVSTRLTSYGHPGEEVRCNIPFYGIDNSIFGVDAYYFINNKRYSRAAAFNYSKIQKRSQGSWFVGVSYYTMDFNFDFNKLPADVIAELPPEWSTFAYIYHIKNYNYAVRGGYAYNWVFHPHWVLGVSESPSFGLKYGTANGSVPRYSVSFYNRAELSCVWNNRAWFAGVNLSVQTGFYFDRSQSLMNGLFNGQACVGYRFNLW